ncbi:MAG: universal stress protein [Elusimicrobia bacterium]|nr:universal stress protein [Elusimicrobiota bacterium]
MILAPIDLSERSYQGFVQAARLAKRFHARLEAVYVLPFPPEDASPFGGSLQEAERRERALRSIRARIGPMPLVHFLEGNPAAAILTLARELMPDLIVMGTHDRSGARRLLMGSVTEAVIRRSPVPVLAVRGEPQPIRSVLAPVKFTAYSDLGLVYAAAVAVGLDAQLTALHVAEPKEGLAAEAILFAMVGRLPAWAREATVTRLAARKGKAVEAIARLSRDHDLVVLVEHSAGPTHELLRGTTLERVLHSCRSPVLAVPYRRGPTRALKGRKATARKPA